MAQRDSNRLEQMADKIEINEVMSKYERWYDTKELDPLLDLFVEDCVVDYGELGKVEGREGMRQWLEEYFGKETAFQDWFHLIANPWIEINGNEAVGRFQFFGPYTMDGVGAAWLFGYYKIDFVRQDGDWKIQTLRFSPKHFAPYDEGWARAQMGAVPQ